MTHTRIICTLKVSKIYPNLYVPNPTLCGLTRFSSAGRPDMAYQTVPQLTIHPDRPCSRLLVCHRTGAGGKRRRSYLFNCVLRQRRSKICFFPNASVRENFVGEVFNVKHQISCHRIVVIAIANAVYAIQADKSEDETDRKEEEDTLKITTGGKTAPFST